jgi:hypothetical protein
MSEARAKRRTCALAAALALAACASAGSGEKGRLVPLDLPRETLDQHYAPKKVALLIGVNRFDDPEWKGLRYTEKDAEDLAAVLRDAQRGAFDHVEVLKDGPTRADIRAAIARLGEVAQDDRDTVLIYFSSHGTLSRDVHGEMKRYLVTRDTRMTEVPATALSVDDLKSEFEALRSRRKVLILAACHSGGGKSLLPGDVLKELAGTKGGFFVRPIEEVSRAIVVLAASDWGETAREDSKLENDIYTHFLVEALEIGYDRNGDGATTVSEAHDYARRLTYEFTAGRQRPSAETTEVGADPIVLVGRVQRRGKPELFSYAPRLDGFTVRVDGKPMAELPGGAAVDPGRHRIQISKGAGPALVDDAVNLGAGERFDLEAFAMRGQGSWEVSPRVGVMTFLDAKSRRDVLGPTVGAGATLTYRDWPSSRVNLRLDAIGAAGSGNVTTGTGIGPVSAPYSYSAFAAGVAFPWRFPVLFDGKLSLLAGPRLSAVYLQRSLKVEIAAPQTFFTLTPGVLGGVSYERGHFTVGAEVQLDFVLLREDNQNRSSGFAEVLFGAGWRF